MDSGQTGSFIRRRQFCALKLFRVSTCRLSWYEELARLDGVGPESVDFRLQRGVLRLFEPRIVGQDFLCLQIRGVQQARVGQLCDLQIGRAALTCPKKLARAAQLEVDLGQLEAVAGLLHGLEPLL